MHQSTIDYTSAFYDFHILASASQVGGGYSLPARPSIPRLQQFTSGIATLEPVRGEGAKENDSALDLCIRRLACNNTILYHILFPNL